MITDRSSEDIGELLRGIGESKGFGASHQIGLLFMTCGRQGLNGYRRDVACVHHADGTVAHRGKEGAVGSN